MGITDPRDLPAKRDEEKKEVIISTVRVRAPTRYKDGEEDKEGPNILLMPPKLSHQDLIACATYTQQLEDHSHSLGPPPDGNPPPGYNDYIRMNARLPEPVNNYYFLSHTAVNHSQNPAVAISMPPEAFHHLINLQVHSMEIMSGNGPGNGAPENPRPHPRDRPQQRGRPTQDARPPVPRGCQSRAPINYTPVSHAPVDLTDRWGGIPFGRGWGRIRISGREDVSSQGSRGRDVPGGLGNN